MKKTIIKGGIALLAIVALSACRKDYSCECEITSYTPAVYSGGVEVYPAIMDTAWTTTIMRYIKKNAEYTCEQGSSVENVGTSTTVITTDCKIIN